MTKKKQVCMECKAYLSSEEMKYHPYWYCLLAKVSPQDWREQVKIANKQTNNATIEQFVDEIKTKFAKHSFIDFDDVERIAEKLKK